jgi:UDP-perosamine 4-acetyltransferase
MTRIKPPATESTRLDSQRAVVVLGAGGHAKVVIEMARERGYFVRDLLDADQSLHGTDVLGIRVLGGDGLLRGLHDRGIRQAVIGVGTGQRVALYDLLRKLGFTVVSLVHSTAVLSPSARWGQGLTVMAGAVVNAQARLGDNVIVNTRAVVEHDCELGDHVHVACGAQLAGGVVIGDGGFVGAGAIVLPGVRSGTDAVIGAGAVVVHDVPSNVVVAGNPARILRSNAA